MFQWKTPKITLALSLAMVVALILSAIAMADDISNNLDASVDAVAEVMPLNVGGANGTTTLYLVERNGDSKNGCNLTGSTTLVLSVSSSDTSVATVSPSSVTFTSCGFTQVLTVTPHNQGLATISVSQTSNNSGGTFNLAPATFTVNVTAPPPANTAPQISIIGVTGGASYEIGSVPAATCEITDAEDGNTSFAATLSAVSGSLASYGLGEQTASCSYTDAGGLTASVSKTYGIVDTTAPVITFVSRTPANNNGWNNGDVTVNWSCTDNGSGVVAASVSQIVSAEAANQSTTGTCEDHAGNTASDTQIGINIDKTAPTASASASPGANANGWNNTNVTVSFSGDDDTGSGIDFCSASVVLSTEGSDQSASGTCTDKAGNVSSPATASGINIDKTAPVITFVSRTAANTNGWNNTDVNVNWNCSDSGSGVVASSVSKTVSAEGADQSATGTCTDKAGNTASDTQTGINIDKTAPSLSIVGANSSSSTVCSALPTKPTFAPTDGLSGIASQSDSWATPSTPSGVGTYTYSATAMDKAGNTASETRTYNVTYGGAFSGYLQPINTDGSSRFKLGSTVPVKFQLMCGATPITNAVAKLYVATGDNVPDPGVDEAISTAASTTGNLFRYDSSASQYIFNLSTKLGYTNPGSTTPISFSTGSWTLKILLDDGKWYSVNIQLPK